MNTNVDPDAPRGQEPSPPTRRVVDVVELLAEHVRTPLSLAEICRQLRISRSTGHAIMATLCACDWATRDPLNGTFLIGNGFPRLQLSSTPITSKLRGPLRELCSELNMAACISEVRGRHIAVIDAASPGEIRPHVQAGQRLPFVAPFGREFVAWAPPAATTDWMEAAGPVNDVYRARMPKVLNEIRDRGYGIERLSDPLLKVYAALLALEDGGEPGPVAVRLAGAVADLTIVDVLAGEFASIEQVPLATISAPIFDHTGNVMLTVSAQPYKELSPQEVRAIGDQVCEFGRRAESIVGEDTAPPVGEPSDRRI